MRKIFALFSPTRSSSSRDDSPSEENRREEDPSPTTSEVDEFFHPQIFTDAAYATATSMAWTPEYASDPNAWEQAFIKQWQLLKSLLANANYDKKLLKRVQESLFAICTLLVTEVNSQPEPSIGPILDYFFNDEILLSLIEWAIKIPLYLVPMCQITLIRAYDILINKTNSQNHCLLVHKPIFLPLLQLLKWCSFSVKQRKSQLGQVDKCFIQLLNQICRRIINDSTLLHLFFYADISASSSSIRLGLCEQLTTDEDDPRQQKFLIFNLLIPYLYAPGDIGQLARDALLLIMSVSKEYDFIAHYASDEGNFCPVLAAGISGCYSELPRSICSALDLTDDDEFYKLTVIDIDSIPELHSFQNALLFCNAIVQVAHSEVVHMLVIYFFGGFLNVFKSSVLEYEGEDLVSDVVYFHMCLETLTEPALIQSLIKVLIATETKIRDLNLLEVILSKMNTSEMLCRVVLSLLQTLLSLRCEDLMWNLILRFILPFIPLKPNSRRFDANVSLNAATFFLTCIPECSKSIKELNSQSTFHNFIARADTQIKETSRCCEKWRFKYDGSTPNSQLNIMPPDDVLSVRQPFVRLSSARSSYASSGWNRYFQNRSAHGTFDGDLTSFTANGIALLNSLGEEDPFEHNNSSDELGEMSPQYELMTDSCYDYFHFTYDRISSDDESSGAHKGSPKDEEQDELALAVHPSPSSANTTTENPQQQRISSEFLKSVVKSNWAAAKTSDEFMHLLDALPPPDKPFDKLTSSEENLALIDSRYQYLEEFKLEHLDTEPARSREGVNPFKLDLTSTNEPFHRQKNGLLLTCTDQKGSGIFFESLMDVLANMPDHNFATNFKAFDVLSTLLSYPQPVLTSYLLYVDSIRSNALYRLTNVLRNLKVRIDAYAEAIPDFDELIQRGLRHRVARSAATDSDRSSSTPNSAASHRLPPSKPKPSSNGVRRIPAPASFRFTHQQRIADEQSENQKIEQSRSKNCAYAAIVLSQLSQLCAAFALQHCPAILPSNRNVVVPSTKGSNSGRQ